MSVSHETIYQYIYVQAKGELKKELISLLRQHKPKRQKRGQATEKRGVIPEMKQSNKDQRRLQTDQFLGTGKAI